MVTTDNGVEHQNYQNELTDEDVECTPTRAANKQEMEANNTALSHGIEMENQEMV
jgi:hypothetical protein